MPAIAAWLVARPQNAVIGLAVTLLLPAPQLTSGVIMVLLVLAHGTRQAVFEALIAAAAILLTSLIVGISASSILALMAGTWVPVLLLAVMLVTMRSLTLVLQVSVIMAMAAMIGFMIVVTDAAAFWEPIVTAMAEMVRQNGLELDTEMLSPDIMTMSATLSFWLLYTAGLLLGYGLYRSLPIEGAEYGRFQDLNFGRVIALTMALVSLLAFVSGAVWLQNIAFTLFVMFMLQGLALVHWMRGAGILPMAALVSVYVLLPILQVLLVMVLALIGYTDAWFGFRRRLIKT